jgi:hypothetical protein
MRNAPRDFKDVCVDATDHQGIADWWCAIGYVRAHPTEGADQSSLPEY